MMDSQCCGGRGGAGLVIRAVGSAIRPGRVLLAVFCLAVLVGGGHIWDAIVGAWISASPAVAAAGHSGDVAPFEMTTIMIESAMASIKAGVLSLSPDALVHGALTLTVGIPMALWAAGAYWFVVLFGLYTIVVLAISIGIQSRFEAITVAEGEPPSMDRLATESSMLTGAFVGAWATPMLIAAVLGALIMCAGLVLLNIPVLNLVGGIVWGFVMLLGLALALTLLGLGVAGALLVPAVAVDGCAGPDAMHRAFTGATSRPLRWLWYAIVIIIGLGLGLLVVETVAQVTARISTGLGGVWVFNDVFVEAARGDVPGESDASWTTQATASIIVFWLQLLKWLVAGWMLCYLSAATTRAWMALRMRAEGMSPEHIWRPGLMPGTLAPEPDPPADDASEEPAAGE